MFVTTSLTPIPGLALNPESFFAMLFAQLAACKNLKDLVFSINQQV